MQTIDYYNQNAQSFFDETHTVDVEPLYCEFLPLLSSGDVIIDAGCGSGRDSKFFFEQHFHVIAFDASESMVSLAKSYTGLAVMHSTFLTFQSPIQNVDAIWACASLLHVPKAELKNTFKHLGSFLKCDGVFYCSFKYGDEEVERNQRQFTNMNEVCISRYLNGTSLHQEKFWISSDRRQGREGEQWLNLILRKKEV